MIAETSDKTTYTITYKHDGKQGEIGGVVAGGRFLAYASFLNLCRAAGVEVEIIEVKEEEDV